MAVTDPIKENIGKFIPVLETGISAIAWLFIIVIFMIVIGVIVFFYVSSKKYKYTIIKWEKINGKWIDTGSDKAMELKLGGLGTRILYWKRTKIYTYYPENRTLLKKFYFKRNEKSGQWENFEIIDNLTTKDLAIDSLQGKMLTQNIGIRKALKDEFNKQNWFKENAVMLVSIAFVIIIGVMFWLMLDKFLAISNSLSGMTKELGTTTEKINLLLSKVDNLNTNTGLVKVP